MTKDTEKVLLIIYCQYKKRINYGTSEEEARYFEDAKLRKMDGLSDWSRSKLNVAVQQLKTLGYISTNILDDVKLLDSGIEFMQRKPKDYFLSFAEFAKGVAELITTFL